MRKMIEQLPVRLLLRAAAAMTAFMALVAVGGTAAAANGVFVPAANVASQTSASRSAAPDPVGDSAARYEDCREVRAAGKAPLYRWERGYRLGLDRDRDGVACEREHDGRHDDGDDGDDGEDGRDGKKGKDGKDGKDGRTVYRDRYITEYLNRGGDSSRVSEGGQVAIYPSGGVGTGA